VRESHPRRASASRHEPDLAASAQAIDGEKYLVPGQIGALPYPLLKVAHARVMQNVTPLIFDGDRVCHLPPLKNEMSCCIEDTALSVPADNLA
jgi:hypothetical protein